MQKLQDYWNERSSQQKIILAAAFLATFLVIAGFGWMASRPGMSMIYGGLDSAQAGDRIAVLISTFAVAVIAGRFVCGVALDRLPAHLVAAGALALPGVGCLLLASGWDSFAVLAVAVCCLGAAWGAEGDVIAYLVARRFSLSIYSTVLSLLSAAIGVSSAVGAVILSLTALNVLAGRVKPNLGRLRL